MFQFSGRFAFLSTVRFSNRTPKITGILTLYQANAPTLMRRIFGTHNLHTFKHNTLINELLLMQFYLLYRPKLHHRKWRKLRVTLHACQHGAASELHQQPVDAVLRPTFNRKLCYKLPSFERYAANFSLRYLHWPQPPFFPKLAVH